MLWYSRSVVIVFAVTVFAVVKHGNPLTYDDTYSLTDTRLSPIVYLNLRLIVVRCHDI